MITAQNGRMRI